MKGKFIASTKALLTKGLLLLVNGELFFHEGASVEIEGIPSNER